jgi:carbamoyltransferase
VVPVEKADQRCEGLLFASRHPMTLILGISAFYHDAAAALVRDGRIVAAAQEERFTRVKHDAGFPKNAVDFCIEAAGVQVEDLDYVGYYEKPLRKFDRLLQTYLAYAPAGFTSFKKAIPVWLQQKLHLPREIDRGLGGRYRGSYVFAEHHESHAASAFYPSPFEEAAILTLDGVGEWTTASCGAGRGNRITLSHELRFPHSLGMLYSAFTYYVGFKVNSGEYKLMGLAPYGEPRFAGLIREHLIDLKADGSFRLDMSYFNYCQGLTMISKKFEKLFGGPPRRPDAPITQREMDVAASIQSVTEEVVLRCARHAHAMTGMRNLALAGGVALNCVANGRILREGPFDRVWVQPAAGDAGGALGTALLIWHQLLDNHRTPHQPDAQAGSLLGPAYDDAEIRRQIEALGLPHDWIESDEALCSDVAKRLARGEVIGWFQGAMEFGPRALGNRSLLGDPRRRDMQSTMNRKIKYRESFRPFAPAVLREDSARYFDLQHDSPYMLLVSPVRADPSGAAAAADVHGFARLRSTHADLPAVTHVDGSARVQTVTADTNPRFALLLESFKRETGCSVLINTSFNVRGEPIVATPLDAVHCFLRTEIDALVVGRCVVDKRRQRALDLNSDAILRNPWPPAGTASAAYSLDD